MIKFLIETYIFVIIADVVLSYLPQFRGAEWREYIKRLADFLVSLQTGDATRLPLDLSPLVVMILLQMLSGF